MQSWDIKWSQNAFYKRGCKGELSCLKGAWIPEEAQAGWRALWKHQHWQSIQKWVTTHPQTPMVTPLFSQSSDAMKAFHFAIAHPAFQPIWIKHALADISHRSELYSKLLWVAIHHQQAFLLKALLQAGLSPWMSLNLGTAPAAGKAAREGWLEGVEIMASFLPYINEADEKGNTLLHWAAASQQTEVIEWLLQQQSNPNLLNQKHHTPLGILLRNDHFSPVDVHHLTILPGVKSASFLLIEHGADPTLHQGKNKSARTALEWARYHDPVFAALLEKRWLDRQVSSPLDERQKGKGRL